MEQNTEKGKQLFDFLNMIQQDQRIESFDQLTEDEEKRYKYSRYMIHRFLSMNPAYLELVNVLQEHPGIPDRAHYLFLINVLPKSKQFNKYIKGAKTEKYPEWMISLIVKHFHISQQEALEYIELYYHVDKKSLRDLCEKYGIDKKQLKQVKL